MASSLKIGGCIFTAFQTIQSQLIRSSRFNPRVLTQLQPVRERRRTCRPPWWFAKKKVTPYFHQQELTAENRQILSEMVHDRYKELPQPSPLKDGPWQRNEWTETTKRTGVLAVKLGVIPQWTKEGRKFHTTLLQVLDNHVIRYVPPEKFSQYARVNPCWARKKYGAVVVGALSCDPGQFTKAYNNLFAEAGVPPKRKLTRFIITPNAAVQPGTPLSAMHFRVGDYVDVQAKTIGHGFQGVVKRWGFKGGPASHGTTKWHRRPGSIGAGREKSGIWKGKKMPGHMGMDWTHLRGLRIWRINTKYNVLYVHGPCLPGPTHCYVRVMDTALKNRRREMKAQPPVMPTFYAEDTSEPVPEELFDEEIFQFSEPTISYQDEKKAKS